MCLPIAGNEDVKVDKDVVAILLRDIKRAVNEPPEKPVPDLAVKALASLLLDLALTLSECSVVHKK